MADVSSINQIVITAKDDTGAAFGSVASGLNNVGSQAQKLVDKFDPLAAKLRGLQSDLTAVSNAVKAGAFGGQEAVTDAIYAKLNADIAQTKGLIEAAAGASTAGFGAAAGAANGLNLATAGVTREFIVLGNEALRGNFQRIPGSILTMAERMGNLTALLNPVTLGFVAIAAGMGMFILAAIKGAQEMDAMNAAITKSGDFAGVTRGQMLQLATQISATGTLTIGVAKDLVTQLVGSGKIGAQALAEVAGLASEYARQTGTDINKVGADLIKLFADPAKGARELIDSLGGVTIAQAEYIRHLQQQGEVGQAQLLLADALAQKLANQQTQLGTLQKVWDALKGAAGSAWDAMLGIGRSKTPEEAYAEARNLAQADSAAFAADSGAAFTGGLVPNVSRAESAQQLEDAREMVGLSNRLNDSESAHTALVKQQLQASDAVNKGQLSQIQNLRDEITLIQNYGDHSTAANQKIAEDQKQIASIYRSMDADHRAQVEGQITEQQKLGDIALQGEAERVAAQLKLGQISQIQHDARMTQIALERNENAINATLQLAQIGTLTAAERARYQAQLSELAAQREIIQQQGADKQLEDIKALQDAIGQISGAMPAFNASFEKLQKDLADAYANGLFGPPGIAALQKYADLTNQLLAQQPFAVRWRDAQAAIERANGAYQDFIGRIRDANERIRQQIDDLGKMPDEIARANAEFETQAEISKELNDLATRYAEALQKNPPLAAQLLSEINDLLDRQGQLVTSAGDLALAYHRAKSDLDDWKSVLTGIADEGAKFIADFVQHGSSAFKNLWNDFKTWALEAFAKIAAQTIIVNIAGQFGGVAQGAANQLFGAGGSQSNPLFNLLGLGSGGNGPLSFLSPTNLAGSIATSAVGQGIGLSTAVGGSAGIAADAVGGIPGGLASDVALTGAGSLLTAAAPFLPLLGLALPLLSGLFSKQPSPVQGQFQVSPGTTGFEDNAFTSSPFGNLGFNDANTQQFSGQAAQALNKIVAGALDAFQSRFSPEQSARLATILQGTTFATQSGTFTTEDFLQKYGGAVLQQVVTAAFNILDPALGAVAANFKGTADEVAKFSNSLLGIYDATKAIGNVDFTTNVDAALADATQATADKVLAFVTIVQQFGDSITGLGPKLEALDPAHMTAFVDALGGAQTALQTMAFIQANFTTATERTSAAQKLLTADFANLHLAVPTTHADFLKLLDSFDLTTAAGQQLYAQVAALAPLFVAVAGTADQAAKKLSDVTQAFLQIGAQALANPAVDTSGPAAGAFIAQSIKQITQASYDLRSGVQPLIHDLVTLGTQALPSTDDGWRKLIDSIKGNDDASSHLRDTLTAMYGAWINLDAAVQKGLQNFYADDTLFTASEQAAHRAAVDVQHFADASAQLGVNVTGNAQQFRALVEQSIALYGADSKQVAILLTLLPYIDDYNKKLQDQTVIISSVGSIVQQAEGLAKTLLGQFSNLAGQSTGDFGAKLSIQIGLINDAVSGASRSQFTSTTAFNAYVGTLKQSGAELTNELTQFTILSAQYDAARAEQLVGLEQWDAQQKTLFAGNADALAALDVIFHQKWDAIVKGVSTGVNGTLDALAKLKDGIANYLKGLQVGSLSPLAPKDQLAQAQEAYVEELVKAQAGNQTALGDITQFADAYLKQAQAFFSAPSSQYRDIFGGVTQQLGTLAGTLPNGLPTTTTSGGVAGDAIAAVIPTNGRMVSNTDIQALGALLTRLATDSTQANSEDIATQTTAITTTQRRTAQTAPLK